MKILNQTKMRPQSQSQSPNRNCKWKVFNPLTTMLHFENDATPSSETTARERASNKELVSCPFCDGSLQMEGECPSWINGQSNDESWSRGNGRNRLIRIDSEQRGNSKLGSTQNSSLGSPPLNNIFPGSWWYQRQWPMDSVCSSKNHRN